MTKLSKYLNYFQYLLFAITIVYAGVFFFGEQIEDVAYPHPASTDAFLDWAKVLFWIAVGVTLLFELYHIVMNPKSAVRTLISLGIILVIVFAAYGMADDTPMKIVGYNGPDNVPSMLTMAGTMLYTMYILFGVTLATILYAEISRLFK